MSEGSKEGVGTPAASEAPTAVKKTVITGGGKRLTVSEVRASARIVATFSCYHHADCNGSLIVYVDPITHEVVLEHVVEEEIATK